MVADMSKIDPMYQFSLEYFKKIFTNSIMYKDEGSPNVKARVEFLERKITEDIYKNIKRGIFETHKAIFSFLINVNIQRNEGKISDDEWSFFIKGPSQFDTSEMIQNPDNKYFSEFQWNSILYFENKFGYDNLSSITKSNLEEIKKEFSEITDFKDSFNKVIDGPLSSVNNSNKIKEKNFLKLTMVKLFRPDKLLYFVKKFIEIDLGPLFVDTSPSRLEEVYEESDWRTPIIFILSKGADPTNEFIAFKNRFQKMKKEEYEAKEAQLLAQQQMMQEQEQNPDTNNQNENQENAEGNENNEEKDNNTSEQNSEKGDEAEKRKESTATKENKDKDNKDNKEQQPEVTPGEFQTYIISLGQGQEEEAKKAIRDYGVKNGAWVLLQNCHLFASFMPDLANIVQSLQQEENIEEINPNFRLWLTSMPVKTFPVSILQNSLKLTTEPPSGIKANMKKLFDDITEEKTKPIVKVEPPGNKEGKTPEEIQKEEEQMKKDNEIKQQHFTKILFSLSLFHAVLQERKKFGPIGFNIRYDFNQSDFDTSSQLVNIYLSEADVDFIPWDSILYLIGEVTYGGSITDETDRIVMNSSLTKFINENLFNKEKDADGNDLEEEATINYGKYSIPAYKLLYEYQKYIPTLPNFDDPDIFGLNENANIVYELKESNNLLDLLSNILPKDKSSGRNSNEIVMEIINNMLAEQIEKIDKKARNKIHDKLYENDLQSSLTIVLFQEIDKYNNLITKIDNTLNELKKAIEGTSVMSSESDEIFHSLLLNKIPSSWSKIGYSSFKSFGSWTNDLKKRIDFISHWLTDGHPSVYWISGLFYPQGFITGVFQNHARETKIPVSDITIKFTVLDKTVEEIQKGPKYGIYVNGLFLEGASWDAKLGLVDQKPGEMRCTMPVIWFETIKEVPKVPVDDDNENEDEIYYYSCPMFKTGKRAQIISSSGNSNEKVLEVELPSKENKDYWILRGAALLMQLDD